MSAEETYSEDGMECPYCGKVNKPDNASDYDEDEGSQWCGGCEKEFVTSCHVSHLWTSRAIED